MKFLCLCIFLLFAHLQLSESAPLRNKRDLRDDLIRRAQRLLFITSGEIQLLKDEGRDIEVKGLEAAEARLIQFELLLQTATNETEIRALEQALLAIENNLVVELSTLGKDHVSNEELEKLISRAQELVRNASEVVKRLKAENKSLLAVGIEQQEVRLLDLELDLRVAKKSEEIRRLAEILVEEEQTLTELLADVSVRKLKKRQADLREQLLRRAEDLIARANAEIAALRAANRSAEIVTLQREEASVQELARELRAATTQTQIRQLEQRLTAAENALDAELRRLEVEVVNTAERDAIISRAEELNARAAAEITALRSEGRTQLAAQLQLEEAIIAQLVRELRAARTGAQIRLLEQRLTQAENRLEAELNRIVATTADPEKDELIRRAEQVLSKASAEANKLKADDRTQEAATLESDERLVSELITELKAVTAPTEVTRVKNALKQSLDRIEAEIAALEAAVSADPERDELFKRAADLKAAANTLVYKLKSDNKELEADLVWAEQQLVDEVVAELTKARDEALVNALKAKLKADLDKLDKSIAQLSAPTDVSALRASVLKRAEELNTKVNEAIAKLTAEAKSSEALNEQQKAVTALIADVNAATTEEQLNKLLTSVSNAESLVNKELEKLSQPVVTDIEALISRAESLALKAKEAIRSLRQQGRDVEAQGLELEVNGLLVLDVLLRSASEEEARVYSAQLTDIENRVQTQLTQLAVFRRKRQAVLQAQLIKRADDLLSRANAEIAALKAANRTSEISLLQAEEDVIKQVVEQLKNASTDDVLQLVAIEQKLIDSENKLDAELKKLEQEVVNNAERDAIIKKAEELNTKAAAEITKLRSEGRNLLAEQLQSDEELIKELVDELKAARVGSQIKQLEQKLNETEKRLEDELSKITHAIADPEKDDLLKRAEEVSNNVTNSVTKLKADNRTQEAATFESEQRLLAELVKQLKKANDTEDVKQAKDSLKQNLDRIEQALKSIVDIKPVDTEKEDLLKRVADLKNRTTTQQYRLKSEGKEAEAATFGAELELIDLLADQLNSASDANELKRVKDRLKEKLDKLEGEIKALEDVVSDPERDALVKRAAELRNRTTAQIEKLRGIGNTTEAESLENERDVVDVLAQSAESAKQADELTRVKASLKTALDKLEAQVKRLESTPIVDAEKVALLNRAEALKNRTTAAINKLKTANRTAEANSLDSELELLSEKASQLEKATVADEVKRLKDSLKQSLDKLEAEVKKLEDTPAPDPEKDALVQRAQNATNAVKDAVAKLKSEDRTQEAATLEAELKLIDELVKELNKSASDPSEVNRLKTSLKESLDKLDEDLKAAAKPLIDEKARDVLVVKVQQLRNTSNEAIEKLKADNRSDSTTELEKQEILLSKLETQLKNVTKPDELKSLEEEVKRAEEALTKELERLSQLEKEIESLSANITQLIDKAVNGSQALVDQGKTAEADVVNNEVTALQDLQKRLRAAKTSTEVTAFADQFAQIAKRLEEELK